MAGNVTCCSIGGKRWIVFSGWHQHRQFYFGCMINKTMLKHKMPVFCPKLHSLFWTFTSRFRLEFILYTAPLTSQSPEFAVALLWRHENCETSDLQVAEWFLITQSYPDGGRKGILSSSGHKWITFSDESSESVTPTHYAQPKAWFPFLIKLHILYTFLSNR